MIFLLSILFLFSHNVYQPGNIKTTESSLNIPQKWLYMIIYSIKNDCNEIRENIEFRIKYQGKSSKYVLLLVKYP